MTNRTKVRLRFRKQQDLRHIGHLDLLRTLERLFRRAGLPLQMSEGFHPKPKLSFPLALAVGIAGSDEIMELELAESLSAEQVLSALAPQCPPGLEFLSALVLPPGSKCPTVARVTYELPVPPERQPALAARIAALLALESFPFQRAGRAEPVDLRALLETAELEAGQLRFTVKAAERVGARPREILAALEIADLESQGCVMTRTAVELGTNLPPLHLRG